VMSLEDFLCLSDKQMYDPVTGIIGIVDRATVKLVNPDSSLASLHRKLVYLNLTDPERMRPGWDAYFMQLASLAAKRSNCMKRRVGCVLVREKRVIATGYNGTPRGLKNCNDGGCARCNGGSAGGTGLDTCLCLHAEENALLEAGRERVGVGATLYCDTYVTPALRWLAARWLTRAQVSLPHMQHQNRSSWHLGSRLLPRLQYGCSGKSRFYHLSRA